MKNKMLPLRFPTITIWLLALFLNFLYSDCLHCQTENLKYEIFGDYSIAINNGWKNSPSKSTGDFYVFEYGNGEMEIIISKDGKLCASTQDLNSYILQVIQKLNESQEFSEQQKPSAALAFLGATTSHLIKIKSRISGDRRFIYIPWINGKIYEISVREKIPGNEPNQIALQFLSYIYLTYDHERFVTYKEAAKNPDKTAPAYNQAGIPSKTLQEQEKLASYKKVKVYTAPENNNTDNNSTYTNNKVSAIAKDAVFSVPVNSIPEGEKLSIVNMPLSTEFLNDHHVEDEVIKGITDSFKLLRVYQIGPEGQKFTTPGTVQISVRESELPHGRELNEIFAVLLSNGETEIIPVTPIENGIQIEVQHCSSLAILIATAAVVIPGMILMGQMLAGIKKGVDPVFKKSCKNWTDPYNSDNENIRKIANDPSKFKINTDGSIFLDVGKPMKGKNIGMGNHLLKPGKFIENPSGDCVNFSNLFGCLLTAKSYPIKVVTGNASYPGYSGGHQWVETVIDGKPYYVDTYNPSQAKLIPLDEAIKNLKLKHGTMCTETGPKKYDKNWYNSFLTDPTEMLNRYNELRELHRTLNESCIGGNNAACDERREVYLDAMELRKKLEAQGIKVVD